MKANHFVIVQPVKHHYHHKGKAHIRQDNAVAQQLDVDKPNQVWTGDMTYLRTKQGGHYTSFVFEKQIKAFAMKHSISKRGNCYDNASTERFFRSLN